MFLARFQALLRAHRCCRSVSSWNLSSNFLAKGLRWWGTLTFIFSIDGRFFSWILAWRSVDPVNRTLWIGSKTFCIGLLRLFTLRNECIWILWYTTQLWYTSHNSHRILVVAFSSFWDVALFRFFIWLFINLVMRKQTLVSSLTTCFIFIELALGRMPLFTRRSRAGTFQIISARLSKNDTMVIFASDTSLPPHTLRPRDSVWRQCFLVFAHDLGLRGGNCNWSPCKHLPFSFHW